MARKLSSIYGQTLKSSSDTPGISTSKNLVIGSDRIISAISATDFPLQVSGGAYISGSVGIGTINPTSKLDVSGNVRVSGVVTATSFSGDGSTLTGIAVTNLTVNNTSVSVASTNGAINFVSNNVLVATMSSERIFSFVPIDLGTNKITNIAAPTSLADASNKDYVDNNVSGDFPVGDYGNLSTGTNDAFGVNTSGNQTFDCLITPSGVLELKDLGVLT